MAPDSIKHPSKNELGKHINVPVPVSGQDVTIPSSPNGNLVFSFDPSEAVPTRDGNSLVLDVNGGKVHVDDFFAVGENSLPTLTLPDGTVVDPTQVFSGVDMTTAAGPSASPSGSGTSYDDNAGSLVGGFDRLGSLGSSQWGSGSRAGSGDEASLIFAPSGTFSFDISTTDPTGQFAVLGGVYEDGMAHQNLGDHSLAAGKIEMTLSPGIGNTVSDIRFEGLTGGTLWFGDPTTGNAVQITADANGVFHLNEGQLTSLYFLPDQNNSDSDIHFRVSVEFTSNGGTSTASADAVIVVDAVADQPVLVGSIGSVDETTHVLVSTEKAEVEAGGYHTDKFEEFSEPAGSFATVTVNVEATFSDYQDGSESHYVLVQVLVDAGGNPIFEQGALEPGFSWAGTVEIDGVTYYRIEVDNSVIAANGGTVDVPVVFETKNVSEDTTYSFKTGAYAEEEARDLELNTDNNTASIINPNETVTTVDVVSSGLTVKSGWASEGNDNAKHLDSGAHTSSQFAGATDGADGAPLTFELNDKNGSADSDDFISKVTMHPVNDDASLNQGSIWINGVEIDSSYASGQNIVVGGTTYTVTYDTASGTVTIDVSGTPVQDLGGLQINYKPSTDYNDADAKVDYTVEAKNGEGATAHYEGNITVVVDAVADRSGDIEAQVVGDSDGSVGGIGVIVTPGTTTQVATDNGREAASNQGWETDSFSQTYAAETYTFNIHVSTTFSDLDGSENHYLLVQVPANGSWTIGNLPAGYSFTPGDTLTDPNTGDVYFKIKVDSSLANPSVDIPLQANGVTGDITSTTVKTGSYVEETKPGASGSEYDTSNNTALRVDGDTVTVQVDLINSGLEVKTGWTYEDGNAGNSSAPSGGGYSTSLGGSDGAPINIGLTGSTTGSGEYVSNIEVNYDEDLGSLYYIDSHGGLQSVPSGSSLSFTNGEFSGKLVFKPADDSDVDAKVDYKVTVANNNGASAEFSGSSTVVVDAVADANAIDVTNDATGYVPGNAVLEAGDYDGSGRFVTAGKNDGSLKTEVTSKMTVEVQFGDTDGSEEHFVLIKVPSLLLEANRDGFEVVSVHVDATGKPIQPNPDGSWPAGSTTAEFLKIPVNDSSLDSNGKASLDIELKIPAESGESNYAVDVIASSVEKAGLGSGEYDLSNNYYYSKDSSTIVINTPHFEIKTSAGWSYEDGDGKSAFAPGHADLATPQGLDASANHAINSNLQGAPLQVVVSSSTGETPTSIDFMASPYGKFYYSNGGELAPIGGKISVDYSMVKNGNVIFVPNDAHSDEEIVLNFTVNMKDGDDRYTVSGSVTVAVDAVADRAEVTGVRNDYEGDQASLSGAAGENVDIYIKASFSDNDGSEKHYLLVEYKEGWDCAGAEKVTIYTDASGNPLQPTGVDASGNFTYSDTSHPVTYWRVDVTDTPSVGGEYKVTLTSPGSATDATYTFKTGTLAEEQVGKHDADGNVIGGKEYDWSNNQAFDIDQNAVIKLDTVDATLGGTVNGVFEDNMPNAHLGSSAVSSTPAFTLDLGAHNDVFYHGTTTNTAITISFDFEAGKPLGTFTVGGVTVQPGWITSTTSGGVTHYEINIPENQIPAGQNKLNVLYKPSANDDTDLKNLEVEAKVQAQGSGETTTLSHDYGTVVVDAVADKPTNVDGSDEGSGFNSVVTSTFTATFYDFDGSEAHTMIIQAPDKFAGDFADMTCNGSSVSGHLLSAQEITDINAKIAAYNAQVPAGQQITALNPSGTYYSVNVTNDMVDSNGKVSVDVNFTMPGQGDVTLDADGNYSESNNVLAWSSEKNPTDGELTTTHNNNDSFTQGDYELTLGSVGNVGISVTNAYEDDRPNAHVGNMTEQVGGLITIDKGASEVVSDLVIKLSPTGSNTTVNGVLQYKGADGLWHDLTPESDGVTYIIGDRYGDDITGLRYKPNQDDDTDVKVDVSGTVTETFGGDTKALNDSKVIVVDAVADKPELSVEAVQHGLTSMNLNISVQFHDYTDGSETHSVVVKVPSSWAGMTVTGSDGNTYTVVQLPDSSYGFTISAPNSSLQGTDGKFDFTVSITLPENSTGSEIKVEAWAKEGATGTDEITTSNNEAVDTGKVIITELKPGSFNGKNGSTFEGNMADQNAADTVTGENNTTPGTGVQIIGSGAAGDGLVVSKVTVELTDADDNPVGNINDKGHLEYKCADGTVITAHFEGGKAVLEIPSGETFDQKNLTFVADGHDSGKLELDITVTVTDPVTNSSTEIKDITSTIEVDAVATRSEEVVATSDNGRDAATFTITTSFGDNDGSENHYVLIEANSDWGSLTGLQVATFDLGDGMKTYYKIPVNTSGSYSGGDVTVIVNDGHVTVTVTMATPEGQSSDTLSAGSYVEETNINWNTENISSDHVGNNVALRPADTIQWEKGAPDFVIDVESTWGFENNAHGDYSETIITITPNPESIPDTVTDVSIKGDITLTITFADGTAGVPEGHFEYNGVSYTPDADGKVTIPGYDSTDSSNKLVFVPEGDSDKDISLHVQGDGVVHYTENGAEHTTGINGEDGVTGGVDIDAVAVKPEFGNTAEDPIDRPTEEFKADSDYKIENIKLQFTDVTDGSEKHYLLMEVRPNWTYNGNDNMPVQLVNGKPYYVFDLGEPTTDGATITSPSGLDVTWSKNADGSWTATVDSVTIHTPSQVIEGTNGLTISYGGMASDVYNPSETNKELTLDNNTSININNNGIGIGPDPNNPNGGGGDGPPIPVPPIGGPGSGGVGIVWTNDVAYENDAPNANLDGASAETGEGAGVQLHFKTTTGGAESGNTNGLDSINFTWDASKGYLTYTDGSGVTHKLESGSATINASDLGNVFFHPQGYDDHDVNVGYTLNFSDGSGWSGSTTIIVDAVAQRPDVAVDLHGTEADGIQDGVDFGAGKQAAQPEGDVVIKVDATFTDVIDGSTNHYVLVQALPGWECKGIPTGTDGLGNPTYSSVEMVYIDGKQYYRVSVPQSAFSGSSDETQQVQLDVVMKAPTLEHLQNASTDGTYDFTINIGAQSIDKHSDLEATLDNNYATELNGGSVTVSVSPVNSQLSVSMTSGYENNQNYDAHGNLVEQAGMAIVVNGLNTGADGHDVISEMTFTLNAGNGEFLYNGVNLLSGTHPGVTVTTLGDGRVEITIDNYNPGSADHPTTIYKPQGHSDTDIKLEWKAEVTDSLSGHTVSQGNSGGKLVTGIVDAVAGEAEVALGNGGVGVAYDAGRTSVKPGDEVKIDFTVSPTDDPNETTYVLLQMPADWSLLTVNGVTLDLSQIKGLLYFPTGNPADGIYYRIPVDVQVNGVNVFTPDSDGKISVEVAYKAPSSGSSSPDSYDIKVGSLVEQQATDKDTSYDNNLNTNLQDVEINFGAVKTGSITTSFDSKIVENDATGTEFELVIKAKDGTVTNAHDVASGNGETINEANLTFTQSGPGGIGGSAGDIVGSVIYDGKVYYITVDADGNGKATIDFGPGGYDGSKLTVVWGKVDTVGGEGTEAVHDGSDYQVSEWNHAVNGDISLTSKVEVENPSSGATSNKTSTVTVDSDAVGDAPDSLHVTVDNGGATAAGQGIQVTVSAHFDDTDGSEKHYLLVEQPSASWTCDKAAGTWVGPDGKTYFKIPVSGKDANPSEVVTLTPPANASTGPIDLNYGGLAIDGKGTELNDVGSTIIDNGIGLTINGVNSTQIDVSLDGMNEDGSSVLHVTLSGAGDTLGSFALHGLPSGSYVIDTSTGLKITNLTNLDGTKAMNGDYEVHPAGNWSGSINLGITGVVSNGSASTTLTGSQSGIIVEAVTDKPNMDGTDISSDSPVTSAGHTAQFNINVKSDFVDTDGSEEHFFLVQVPSGVTAPAGWVLITDAAILAKAGLTSPVYMVSMPNASSKGISLNLTVDGNYDGDIKIVAGSVESSLKGEPNAGGYEFSDVQAVTPPAGPFNLAPVAPNLSFEFDTLRDTEVNGNIAISDGDGDHVSLDNVSGGATVNGSDANGPYIEVVGKYGTLRIYENGNYVYKLDPAMANSSHNDESFTYTVSDGHGGTSTGTITIDLTNINQNPTITGNLTNDVHGNSDVVTGQLAISDPEGDQLTSITVKLEDGTEFSVNSSGTTVINGLHGTLTIDMDNNTYKYDLYDDNASQHMTGSEKFVISAQDEHNGQVSHDLDITINPINHAPDVQTTVTENPLYGTAMTGELDLNSYDKDTGFAQNHDSVILTHVNGVEISGTTVIHGTYGDLTINADGTYSYTLIEERTGGRDGDAIDDYDKFTITVQDSGGLSDSGDFYIKLGDAPALPASASLSGYGHASGDSLDHASATDYNVIHGTAGHDTLTGTDGHDVLYGHTGNDIIHGGNGDDLIYGGQGHDILVGGSGADIFAWTSADTHGGSYSDTVADFNLGEGDKLSLGDLFGEINSQTGIVSNHDGSYSVSDGSGHTIEAIFGQDDVQLSIKDDHSNTVQTIEVQMSGGYSEPIDAAAAQQMLEQMIKTNSGGN